MQHLLYESVKQNNPNGNIIQTRSRESQFFSHTVLNSPSARRYKQIIQYYVTRIIHTLKRWCVISACNAMAALGLLKDVAR